jgi:hypothetical protein
VSSPQRVTRIPSSSFVSKSVTDETG